ncbi:MAG: hypothetical protein AB1633_05440 [Elusimicrobiota bacterium]
MSKEKEYWQLNIDKLAEEMLNASASSTNEEELKMKVEPLLQWNTKR